MGQMIDFLNQQWWLAISLVVVLFLVDHYTTLVGARLHKAILGDHIFLQNGYELNPMFEKNIKEQKWFTRKHFWGLLVGCTSLIGFRFLIGIPYFEFFIGSFLLLWLYIDLRNIKQIIYLQDVKKPNSITFTGVIKTSYWISQRSSAMGYMSQAILYIVPALATMRPFFWGGVVGCLIQYLIGLSLSNRIFPEANNGVSIEKQGN
jgi:hypothetical protein